MISRSTHRFAYFLFISFGLSVSVAAVDHETITFPSQDGVTITADLYQAHQSTRTPFIVLFHQAGFSRGEYREIAPRLNALGFNAMAVDQRSGGTVNGVTNETAQAARAANTATGFLEAQPDMRAAIAYAKDRYASGAVLGWGSSYSSALILKLSAEMPGLVDGALSFSPSEYFTPKDLITTVVADLKVPVFISSARGEVASWRGIVEAVASSSKVSYIPTSAGSHGSSALWSSRSDHEGYWQAVQRFLSRWLSQPSPSLQISGTDPQSLNLQVPRAHLLYLSQDLMEWRPIAPVQSSDPILLHGSPLKQTYFRSLEVEAAPVADVSLVTARGSAGNYTFSVRIASPDLGCEQYADWWEVLDADGKMIYRRILTHSHVTEQPFTRSGGPVVVQPNEIVVIRAHMNTSGFGGTVFQGSVATGFEGTTLPGTFATWSAFESPLPDGCGF